MSVFSSWDFTAVVTIWRPVLDEFNDATSWGRTTFKCSFMEGGLLAVDDRSEEFQPRSTIYLEAEDANLPAVGDVLVLGDDASSEPPDHAETVRSVRTANSNTFLEGTPDRVLLTS